jgi:hypothetical protein
MMTELMESHAHIFCLYQLYHVEEQPRHKLTRMISLFERIIKYHHTVAMAEYFRNQQWSETDKDLFIQSLRNVPPSLWRCFGNELFQELVSVRHSFLLPSFPREYTAMEEFLNASGSTILSLIRSFARGMVSSDNKAIEHIQTLSPKLERFLKCKWLTESRLLARDGLVWLTKESNELSLHPLIVYSPKRPYCSDVFFDDGGKGQDKKIQKADQ